MGVSETVGITKLGGIPDKTESTHAHRLQVGVSGNIVSIVLIAILHGKVLVYLLVISKVVPKIWARTNSAMVTAVKEAEFG